MQEFLNDRSLPLQLRLDCLDVMASIRPAARILVQVGAEAEKVCTALLNSGIAISVAKGVKRQPTSKQITVHDWFDQSEPGEDFLDMAVLYVAKDQDTADSVRSADETKDDVLFGKALGYPSCCVEWVNKRGSVPEIRECFALYAQGSIYDPLVWPGAMLLDAPLTPHNPCSKDCGQSKQIALSRLRELERINASQILRSLTLARALVYWINEEGDIKTSPTHEFNRSQALTFAYPDNAPI
jgi:hypothetical protein